MLAEKRATTSRPSYSKGTGGIETKTSSVRRATSASTSADSHALTNLATIASSEGESGAGAGSRSAAGGCRRWRLARARLRALVTDSTVESSMPATSSAWKPRTSRRTSTATWRGGRTWSAVTKAREIASVCSRSEEHTSELQSRPHLVCRLLLEKKKKKQKKIIGQKKKKKKKNKQTNTKIQ